MPPEATGFNFSAQFLLTFPTAFHWYPLETVPHSLKMKKERMKKERRRSGIKALTCFVMPFDHTFIFRPDGHLENRSGGNLSDHFKDTQTSKKPILL